MRDRGPTTYRLYVMAPDVTDVVTHAAGLIVDRVMAGWRVSVALVDAHDAWALRILGADTVDLGPELDSECCALAVASELYAEEGLPVMGGTDVLVWGESSDPGVRHALSAAARAFKAHALAAVGAPASSVDGFEVFCAAAGVQYRARVAR
ncbi:hypothetical protein [Mycolicibacterium mageritense]|uniref:hypothetical protein n=1 Tax=Mycolicibacterium mageritense TaxID=53462 RepID=UPI0011D9C397|nr:hypothetical protein [Mycolicibacterium mageritense]TXI65790.1 MAG: hypothetical protein E6Q55_00755 [Mycolicibacterium mageritense]